MRQLIARYRTLPEGAQGQVPALLNALGKLDLAAGETRGAAGLFAEVADQVAADAPALAEARYNQFRAALEGRDWAGALAALRAAAGLDPGRFAPFPLRKYEPLAILGAGAFGVVFLCRHRHVDAPVVIKSLHAEGLGQGIAQIFREGRLLKGLNHPAVVRVEDCDYADVEGQGRPYLVMEHFEGEDLDRWLRRHGPLSAAEIPSLARPLAAGMQAAHARGVLHRDLKPANLLVRRNGGWALKIIDFGLAQRQDPDAPGATRVPGAETPTDPTGTLQFAPPRSSWVCARSRWAPTQTFTPSARPWSIACSAAPSSCAATGAPWRPRPPGSPGSSSAAWRTTRPSACRASGPSWRPWTGWSPRSRPPRSGSRPPPRHPRRGPTRPQLPPRPRRPRAGPAPPWPPPPPRVGPRARRRSGPRVGWSWPASGRSAP